MSFLDRRDAGCQLAARVAALELVAPIVVALPRGGVPVGAEIARVLDAPLDVLVVRKLGAPGHPELGIGAIAEGGVIVVRDDAIRKLRIGKQELASVRQHEETELARRTQQYRHGHPIAALEGRAVVIVDDGLATGVTAEAAVTAVRQRHPRRVILAVPVCAPDSARKFSAIVDELVCVSRPAEFWAVGSFYERFDQVTDAEVEASLAEARRQQGA